MSRFEVRESEISVELYLRFPDLPRTHYTVWDTQAGRSVPFGGYSDRERAQARVDREEAKLSGDPVCVCTHPRSDHNINDLCIAVPGITGCGCLGFLKKASGS